MVVYVVLMNTFGVELNDLGAWRVTAISANFDPYREIAFEKDKKDISHSYLYRNPWLMNWHKHWWHQWQQGARKKGFRNDKKDCNRVVNWSTAKPRRNNYYVWIGGVTRKARKVWKKRRKKSRLKSACNSLLAWRKTMRSYVEGCGMELALMSLCKCVNLHHDPPSSNCLGERHKFRRREWWETGEETIRERLVFCAGSSTIYIGLETKFVHSFFKQLVANSQWRCLFRNLYDLTIPDQIKAGSSVLKRADWSKISMSFEHFWWQSFPRKNRRGCQKLSLLHCCRTSFEWKWSGVINRGSLYCLKDFSK